MRFLAVVRMSGCIPQMILEVKASDDEAAKKLLLSQLEAFRGKIEEVRFAHVMHLIDVDPPR